MLKLKRNTLATAEADLATLHKRKAALQGRANDAAALLTLATGERRRLLIESDEPDAAALVAADRACREASDAEASARDALREVNERIVSSAEYIERLKAAELRERQAGDFERAADQVESAIGVMLKSVATLDKARRDLAASLTVEMIAAYSPAGDGFNTLTVATGFDPDGRPLPSVDLDAETVAVRILASIVAPALPGLGTSTLEETSTWRMDGRPVPILAPAADADAARALLPEPLRRQAHTLRGSALT